MPENKSYYSIYENADERSLVVFEEGVLIAWRALKADLGLSDQEVEEFLKEHVGTIMYG